MGKQVYQEIESRLYSKERYSESFEECVTSAFHMQTYKENVATGTPKSKTINADMYT